MSSANVACRIRLCWLEQVCPSISQSFCFREKEGDLIKVTALRGKGTFVGDIAAMDVGINTELGGWVSEVTARGPLIGRFMTFKRFYALSAKYPEMEADGRAG